jgi:hypothetical protein
MDELRARNLLQAYNLQTVNGCICDLQDSNGKHYHVPNFCINDPFFEKEIKQEDSQHIAKRIKVKLHELYNNKFNEVEVEDSITGFELKEKFCKLNGVSDVSKVRAFFGGTEIENDNSVYRYNIKSGYTIMIMIKKDD